MFFLRSFDRSGKGKPKSRFTLFDIKKILYSRRLSQRFGLTKVKRKRRIQILLVIIIFLLFPWLSAYTNYYVLMEADFLSAQPKFENTDLECLVLYEKQRVTAISGLSYAFQVANNLIGHFSCFYYQVAFPQVKPLVLRC
jgi:hypothetical protein